MTLSRSLWSQVLVGEEGSLSRRTVDKKGRVKHVGNLNGVPEAGDQFLDSPKKDLSKEIS